MGCRVTLLGGTGSVGRAAGEFLKTHPEDYQTIAITGHRNVARLKEMTLMLKPELAVISDETCWQEFKHAFAARDIAGLNIRIAAGREGLMEAAQMKADKTLAAIVGAAGLEPTLWAAQQGAEIALANKECLVMAGNFFLKAAKKILPVDSEHNAIFQIISDNRHEIKQLILTSSGGPFQKFSAEQMAKATPEQAKQHPNWTMGDKISIDSATMMNKALELIEAHYLFDISREKLDILIHPQQIIHSMVRYQDGSILAQLGVTDMYLPVAHALSYPKRLPSAERYHLDFMKNPRLDFMPPDAERFPALRLAQNVLKSQKNASVIFNAANEVAVAAFSSRQIPYPAITAIIEQCLQQSDFRTPENIEDILAADSETRIMAASVIEKLT